MSIIFIILWRFKGLYRLTNYFRKSIIVIVHLRRVSRKGASIVVKTARLKRDFTEGSYFKPILLFSLPIILTNLIQQLYSVADNIVVGKFSGDPLALAAVGTTTSVSGLLLNFIVGLAAGAGVVVAHAVGAKDNKAVSRMTHTIITLSLMLGFGIGIPSAALAKPMLVLTNTPTELTDSAAVYLSIIFLGFPAVSVYNFAAAILRAAGDSKTSLIVLSSSGISNVVLNVVFVVGFKMSVVGVALATVISQYASAAIIIAILLKRKNQPYALKIKSLRLDGAIISRTVKMGLPAAIQNCMFSLANLMITVAVNALSTAAISAKAIFMNLISLMNAITSSYTAVNATFAGQNFGAGKHRRITGGLLISLLQATVISLAACLTTLFFLTPLGSLYIDSADPAREAILAEIRSVGSVIFPVYFIGGIMNCLSGTLRGMGFSFFNMIISVVGICGFRITWILTAFNLPAFHSLRGVYISWPISWGIVTVAFAIIFAVMIKRLGKSE